MQSLAAATATANLPLTSIHLCGGVLRLPYSSAVSVHRRLFPGISNNLDMVMSAGRVSSWTSIVRATPFSKAEWHLMKSARISVVPRCTEPSSSNETNDNSTGQPKAPFGYTRKDVLLIGVGVTVLGFVLKYGLEFLGVDPLQAGNVVQLVLVLGLTVGWISTYIFRVSNKEMTYAQQLRNYEYKVMEKRLDSLTEAELQALLEQVEEEKSRKSGGEKLI
ncbi:hypothetical protein AKJ16_DCAP13412 [Drosera capensis]